MRPRALGVHVFAGGMSLGVEQHFDVVVHLERGSFGVKTWRCNRIAPVVVGTEAWPRVVSELRGTIDLVYGNPPCSPYSMSTNHSRERAGAMRFVGWVEDLACVAAAVGAKIVLIESVRGAVNAGPFEAAWKAHRTVYGGLTWALVDAANHGIPQRRPRAFCVMAEEVVGLRSQWLLMPRVVDTIAGVLSSMPNAESIDRTAWRATKMNQLISLIGPGQRLGTQHAGPEAAQLLKRAYMMRLPVRVTADGPAPVVFGHTPRLIHPTEHRFLTVRELARLCGFPDDFEFMGGVSDQLCQLGKGVCPPVAEWAAGEVAAYLRGERAARGEGMATVDTSASSSRQLALL